MFNRAISRSGTPITLSSDNDPLYRFARWQANLRILGIEPVRSIPYAPLSHPFVERLIGTIRREYLDHVLFWNETDLERKLNTFKDYFNDYRVHQGIGGITPTARCNPGPLQHASLESYGWRNHCRGLFQTPVAI